MLNSATDTELEITFPGWAQYLFRPYRYKVAYGGRGSGKSWAYARALIVEATKSKQRILCTREVQKSIKDSVHRLLGDQIDAMGLGPLFEVQETAIYGPHGSEFLFAGLANHTVESIKSYEGINKVWIEEAQTVSKKSWDILIPTIRADCSEIWVSFNPVLDSDETWRRFVESPAGGSYVAEVNYSDNPWFPAVLDAEREHCRITAPADYENIWLGKCRSSVDGAIYATELNDATADGRICAVPYDPRLKVHTIWDLGWNDSMSIILAQKGVADIRVIDYIEDDHKTLDWYVAELQKRQYNWGFDWLPHDGAVKDFKTGKSTAEILAAFGRKTKQTPNIAIESGIKAARMTIPRCYFDKAKTARLIECIKRYRRQISTTTGEAGSPVHDQYSHGADALRYLGVVSDMLRNEDERAVTRLPAYRSQDSMFGQLG